jgi:hypothetical protein
MFEFLDDEVTRCAERIKSLGGRVSLKPKAPPSTEAQVARVTRWFGGKLPPELLALCQFAHRFEFFWQIDCRDDPYVAGICIPSGRLSWDFDCLSPATSKDYWWAEEIVKGEREGVWHEKAIIDCEGDGDFLAYTTDPAMPNLPVYCAKDGCEPTELVLGNSLADFYREWARIGFLSINKFYEWPRKTGLDAFDVSYFSEFERLLDLGRSNLMPR